MHDAAASATPDLQLPDADHFRSLPPRLPLAQLILKSRQLRQWFPQGVRSAKERWQAKTAAEFQL